MLTTTSTTTSIKARARLVCAIPLVLALGGCVAVASEPLISAGLSVAQAGTAAFRQGEVQAALRNPHATDVADLDSKRGIITAREAGGRLIEINTVPVSAVVTSLRIKVGFFGDQSVSRLLLDEILKELGPDPAVAR